MSTFVRDDRGSAVIRNKCKIVGETMAVAAARSCHKNRKIHKGRKNCKHVLVTELNCCTFRDGRNKVREQRRLNILLRRTASSGKICESLRLL